MVGRKIVVRDVISRSTGIISRRPSIILLAVIPAVFALLGDLIPSASALNPLRIVSIIGSDALAVIVSGAYPSIVKTMLDGGQVSMADALAKAYHRFWAILIAGILVSLLVALGLIAFLVPGLILGTWYVYSIPAIMLEDKGALQGMAASKAFGRDKKWSTFLIIIIVGIGYLAIDILELVLSPFSPLLAGLVDELVAIPLTAWISVILAYTYLTYGPSSVPVTSGVSGYGVTPQTATQQPPTTSMLPPSTAVLAGAPADSSASTRFCPSCGSPIQASSRFCSSCGKAL